MPTWSTLVGEAEREPSSDTDPEDAQLPLYMRARGCGPWTTLLVRQPPGLRAHELHLAYCMQRAEEKASARLE